MMNIPPPSLSMQIPPEGFRVWGSRLRAHVSVVKFRYSTYRYMYMTWTYIHPSIHPAIQPTVKREPNLHPNDDDDPSDDDFVDWSHNPDRVLPDSRHKISPSR